MFVFRAQTDTMPERCAAVHQIFELKGAKKSIRDICCAPEHHLHISWSLWDKMIFWKQNKLALLALSGIIILANTFQITRNNKQQQIVKIDKWCSTAGSEKWHGYRQQANKGSVFLIINFIPHFYSAHWRWKGYFNIPWSLAILSALLWGDEPPSIMN